MRTLLIMGMMGAVMSCAAQEAPGDRAVSALSAPQDQPQKEADKPQEQKKETAKDNEAKQEAGKEQPPVKDDTKKDDTKKDDTKEEKKGDEPAEGEEEEEKKERKPLLHLEAGWADWGLSGLERKFRQYATPPRGWFLRDFRLAPLTYPAKQDALVTVKSLGLPDYIAEGRVAYQYGGTILGGMLSRNQFFAPTPAFIPASERRVDGITLRQSLTKNAVLSFRYRLDEQNEFFEPPLDPLRQRTRYRDLTASGRIGSGFASLSFLDTHYQDRTSALPDTTTRGFRLGYLWEINPNIGLETAFTRFWIDQQNRSTSRIDTISVDGDVSLGPATDLTLAWRQRNVDLPVVQNNWVRHQNVGSLRLGHRWKGWAAQMGFTAQEAERIRSDRTFVDVPRWFTFDGRLSGRLGRNLRVSLRGSTQSLSNAPIMVTQDARSLYFNGRDQVQLKLDGGVANLNGYFTYAYRQWRNGARAIDLTNHSVIVGGDWQVSSPLNLFAEYSHEDWSGKTDVTAFPTLGNFTPDSHIFVVGLNWTLNPRTFLSLSYSEFSTENDNPLLLREGNTNGRFFTLNGRYQFPSGFELGLLIAPQVFNDRVVNTIDYDATVVMFTAAARF